jgi:hypothetical protein
MKLRFINESVFTKSDDISNARKVKPSAKQKKIVTPYATSFTQCIYVESENFDKAVKYATKYFEKNFYFVYEECARLGFPEFEESSMHTEMFYDNEWHMV